MKSVTISSLLTKTLIFSRTEMQWNYIYRIFFVILFLFVFKTTVIGQNFTVEVLDQKTLQPVQYAYVCFQGIDEKFENSLLTDISGKVSVKLKNKCLLAISSMGYLTYKDTVGPGLNLKVLLIPSALKMDEVVVTAQFTPKKADQSIYKVKVIGTEQIGEKGAVNIGNLLSNELNIRITNDATLGSSMKIQGLSGEHIKFLIDGVPVIGRMDGNIDLSQLNLNNVDHIEVVEGPMSVVYGSNALAGAVNIITKENSRNNFSARLNSYYESVGVYNFDGSISMRKKNHSIFLSGGRNFFGGFSEDTFRSQDWKPKRQYLADFGYIFKKDSFKFRLKSSYFNELLLDKGNIDFQPYSITARDMHFYTLRSTNTIQYSKLFRSSLFIDLNAAYSWYNRIKNTFIKDLTNSNELLSANSEDHDTLIFNAWMLRGILGRDNPAKKLNYQIGLDLNIENGKGKRIMDNEQQIGDYAGFASVIYQFNKNICFQPGLRFIYNTKYKAPLVPSLNFKAFLFKTVNFRASYSRGFRSPSLKELYYEFVDINHNIKGNEGLKAEFNNSFNTTFSLEKEFHKRNLWNTTLSLFYNNGSNIIKLAQLNNSSLLYSYINIDKYKTQGGDFSIEYFRYPVFKIKIGTSLTGISESFDFNGNSIMSEFVYTHDFISSMMYKIPKTKVELCVFYKYTGRYYEYSLSDTKEIQKRQMNPFHTLDISLSRKFYKNRIDMTIGAKNLFDVKAVNSSITNNNAHSSGNNSALVAWGRTFFIRLSYGLDKQLKI